MKVIIGILVIVGIGGVINYNYGLTIVCLAAIILLIRKGSKTKETNAAAASAASRADEARINEYIAYLWKGYNAQTHENGVEYKTALDNVAYACAEKLVKGTCSPELENFIYGDAEYIKCIEYVGHVYDSKKGIMVHQYKYSGKNLYDYIVECRDEMYARRTRRF